MLCLYLCKQMCKKLDYFLGKWKFPKLILLGWPKSSFSFSIIVYGQPNKINFGNCPTFWSTQYYKWNWSQPMDCRGTRGETCQNGPSPPQSAQLRQIASWCYRQRNVSSLHFWTFMICKKSFSSKVWGLQKKQSRFLFKPEWYRFQIPRSIKRIIEMNLTYEEQ